MRNISRSAKVDGNHEGYAVVVLILFECRRFSEDALEPRVQLVLIPCLYSIILL